MGHKKKDVLFFPRVWLYARTGSGHRSVAERQLKELREWATCNGYCVVGQSCECVKANLATRFVFHAPGCVQGRC